MQKAYQKLFFLFILYQLRFQKFLFDCCYLLVIKLDSELYPSMHLRISRSFIVEQDDNILKEGYVQKKSKWLKSWRRRKMVLFSNKIAFCSETETKPKDSNIIYLGSISSIEDNWDQNCLIKIMTTNGNFEIKFESSSQKQSWIDDIKEASRTFKILRSQFPESKQGQSRSICPTRMFCITSQSF